MNNNELVFITICLNVYVAGFSLLLSRHDYRAVAIDLCYNLSL